MRSAAAAVALLAAPAAHGADWTNQPGLYATLDTTMGDITVNLCYELAPRASANFLSLAEGSRAWVDFQQGRAKCAPFYDGLIFHRVISNFMIQAGSPNRRGNDSPGYKFDDEFCSELTHSNAGVVSMANSGPDANGSQFFITHKATPWLDNVHAVFGHVVEGMNVVSNIGAVATDTNDCPCADVVIQHVSITRNGAAASNFLPGAVSPRLPDVHPKDCTIGPDPGGDHAIRWGWKPDCWYYLFSQESLAATGRWYKLLDNNLFAGRYILDVMDAFSNHVFSAIEVEYFE